MAGDEEDKAKLAAQALGPAAKAFGKEIEPLGKEAGQIAVRVARASSVLLVVWSGVTSRSKSGSRKLLRRRSLRYRRSIVASQRL